MRQSGASRRPLARALVVGLVLIMLLAATGVLLTRSQDDAAPAVAPSSGSAPADRPDPANDARYAAFYDQEVAWRDCEEGFECASVTVPVDWDAPDGQTIDLAVIRVPAQGDAIGSLFINPGGPGVSGVEFLRTAVDSYDPELRRVFHLTSWDTRGTGGSESLTCLPNSALDSYYAEDVTPDSPAEEATFVDETEEYAQACEANSGALLEHVDTISTARDMDVLREVVGDERMVYLGASYGTFMGAWYAELFPWRVGRLVLDGAVDPSLTAAEYSEGQARGFARAVQAYVDDCLEQSDCPLRGTREDAYGQLERLLARADEQALETTSRPLTQSLLVTGLIQGLYSESLWPLVTEALADALNGDGTAMLTLADFYLEREEDGTYGKTLQVLGPIYCLDHADTRTLDQIRADAAELGEKYPPFGDNIGWGALGCSLWPVEAVVPAQPTTAQGAAPILVVGTTEDPATPYEWSQALAEQLSSGVLVTREGQGHTAYGMGSACIDDAVEDYLVRGVVPQDGTRCR